MPKSKSKAQKSKKTPEQELDEQLHKELQKSKARTQQTQPKNATNKQKNQKANHSNTSDDTKDDQSHDNTLNESQANVPTQQKSVNLAGGKRVAATSQNRANRGKKSEESKNQQSSAIVKKPTVTIKTNAKPQSDYSKKDEIEQPQVKSQFSFGQQSSKKQEPNINTNSENNTRQQQQSQQQKKRSERSKSSAKRKPKGKQSKAKQQQEDEEVLVNSDGEPHSENNERRLQMEAEKYQDNESDQVKRESLNQADIQIEQEPLPEIQKQQIESFPNPQQEEQLNEIRIENNLISNQILSITLLQQPMTFQDKEILYQNNPHYQEWSVRSKRWKVDLEKIIRQKLPKLSFFEEDAKYLKEKRLNELKEIIIAKYEEFCSQSQGSQPSCDQFLEEEVAQKLFTKIIAFSIEGSRKSLNKLSVKCSKVVEKMLPEFQSFLSIPFMESLITPCSLRKAYGFKQRNAQIYRDESQLSLWCWEIQNNLLLEPISENQIKKIRTQRALIGKKVQLLNSLIEMCNDFNTYDSEEKLSKLNVEFENYNKLLIKERTSNINADMKKRKHSEVGEIITESNHEKQNNFQSDNQSSGVASKYSSVPQSKASKQASNKKVKQVVQEEQQQSSVQAETQLNETVIITPQIEIQPQKKPKDLFSFFKQLQPKNDNTTVIENKSEEQLKSNPHIHFKAFCESESQKLIKIIPRTNWSNKNELKSNLLIQKNFEALQLPLSIRRNKHILLWNSSMSYWGTYFDKKSTIVTCRNPLKEDPSNIDYELDSDEEWQELNCDNLEDENLLEEDNSEENQDDPDLRKEGFIVADDYYSQNSSIYEDECDKKEEMTRKDLLRKQLERHEQKLRSNTVLKPYIFQSDQYDLTEYRAVSFKKIKTVEKQEELFPLQIQKSKRKQDLESKVDIKDMIDQLIQMGHGTVISKKQLIESLKSKFGDLRKTHVELFVKECFHKEKRPLDSKTRLYAKVEAVEKYGGSPILIENLPLILEEKRDQEKIAKQNELASKGKATTEQNNEQSKPDGSTHQETHDVDMQDQTFNNEESWIDVLPGQIQKVEEQDSNKQKTTDVIQTLRSTTNLLNHSSSLLEEQDISLSQHAYVQYKDNQYEIELNDSTFLRSTQQNHSTPINDFRKLRSRDVSNKNSQNTQKPRKGSRSNGRPKKEKKTTNIPTSIVQQCETLDNYAPLQLESQASYDSPKSKSIFKVPNVGEKTSLSKMFSQMSQKNNGEENQGNKASKSKRLLNMHQQLVYQNNDDELNQAYSQQIN